jgi:hypothetical protein
MSPRALFQNGNGKFTVSLFYGIVMTIVLVVQQITIPKMADGRTHTQAIALDEQRLDRIERTLEKMSETERTLGKLVEGQAGVQKAVERTEQKLDNHIADEGRR